MIDNVVFYNRKAESKYFRYNGVTIPIKNQSQCEYYNKSNELLQAIKSLQNILNKSKKTIDI